MSETDRYLSAEPKPGKAKTFSTTTTPPIMKAMFSAVAFIQGISALGSTCRAMITPSTTASCVAHAFLVAARSRTAIETAARDGYASAPRA